MEESPSNKVPVWFWIVSGLAVIWNLLGVGAYLMQVNMTADDMAALTEAERQLYETMPAWATGAFALGVFGGVLASLALLLRNTLAVPLFSLSLAAILVQMFHGLILSNSLAVYGPQAAIMPTLIIVIAALLLWFALKVKARGWLG